MVDRIGAPGLHFHDLSHRHAWATATGATLRDLMDRMGHSTTRAALIYIHKTAGRERKIADALSRLAEESRRAKGTMGNDKPKGYAGGTTSE